MLVQQINRMENSIASMKQSQTKQKTGTPSIRETTAIENDNISLHVPVDKALCGESNQPSVEEKNPCDPEFNGNLESPGSSAVIKSTGNRSLVAALFKRPTGNSSESSMSQEGRNCTNSRKRGCEEGHEIDVGDEIVKQIVYEKETPKANGPPILSNLAEAFKKFWLIESKNDQIIKKLKLDYVAPSDCEEFSNCEEFHVPLLNEEILKNKNIHSFYKRNDKRWFDIQNLILRATAAVLDIANICLVADNKNRLIQSKDVLVRSIDTITLLGSVSQQITIELKDRLKTSLSEDYRNICDQDHSNSKLLFGDDLAENVKRAKATYSLNQSISAKKIRTSSSTPSRSSHPAGNYQSSKNSLNSQGRKKNFTHQTSQPRFPHKRTPDRRQKRN